MNKFKLNDSVIVLVGQDKGKIGKIERIISKASSTKVVVSGVRAAIKSVKRDANRGVEGGLNSINLPVDISNIAIYNKDTAKKDKIKIFIEEQNGKMVKVRKFSSNNNLIEVEK